MAKSKNSKDISDKDGSVDDASPDVTDVDGSSQGAPDDVTERVVVADASPDTTDAAVGEGAPEDVTDRVKVTDDDTIATGMGDDASPVVQEEPGITAEPDAAKTAEDTGPEEPLFPADPAAEHSEDSVKGSDTATVPPQVIRETVVQKRGGFFPVLIGGVLAAGAGFLAAQYESGDWPFGGAGEDTFAAEVQSRIDTQQGAVDALTNRIDTVETSVADANLGSLDGTVTELAGRVDAVTEQVSGLADKVGLLEVRLVELEKAPMAESVSPEAIAAYERELEALRADVAQQRSEIETMASDAMAAEENAAAQAELAKARTALAELTAAIDTGAPFGEAITKITEAEDVAVPEALSTVSQEGVPTLNMLVAEFPGVARDGLAAAREAGATDDSGGRMMNFFREQLGARSVTPQDGDDPDAVLSRAEAALKSGDLQAALNEIDTLPDVAKEAMSGWISKAQMRLQVQAAAMSLSQELNKQ